MQMFLPPVLRPMSRDMRMEEVEQNHRQDITRSVNKIWASSETDPTCGLWGSDVSDAEEWRNGW